MTLAVRQRCGIRAMSVTLTTVKRVVFAAPSAKRALIPPLSLLRRKPIKLGAPQRLPASGARSDWIGVEHMQGNPNIRGGAPGLVSPRVSQRWLLEAVQRGDSFVYALITREGAVKIGVSKNLMNRKQGGIGFGGASHFVGYMPGDYEDEQRIHRSLVEYRIPRTREYYYPVPGVLPAINEMREWMGIRELRRRALPRPQQCKFLGRVVAAEARGTSVFK